MPPDTTPPVRNSPLNQVMTRAVSLTAAIIRALHDLPPDDLVVVLRSPIGPPRIIHLTVYGRRVIVDVNPQGRVDYEAEQQAWDCIRFGVLRGAVA